jgi:hypothetical protein
MQKACWVLIIFLIVLGGSCLDNDVCLRGADNALVIEFKKFSEGIAVDDTVTFLNIEAEGTNVVFYRNDTTDVLDTLVENEEAIVTVNPYADETLLTFNHYGGDSLVSKILRVGYKTEVRFVSEACGSERLQYDLIILETTFDSVRVVSNSLNKGQTTNIEIYH